MRPVFTGRFAFQGECATVCATVGAKLDRVSAAWEDCWRAQRALQGARARRHDVDGTCSLPPPFPCSTVPTLANRNYLEEADAGHHLPHVDLARRLRRRAGPEPGESAGEARQGGP